MDRKLYEAGHEVNSKIVAAQVELAGYNFYTGNRDGMAKQADIDKIRDLLAEAEYISRSLSSNGLVLGVR